MSKIKSLLDITRVLPTSVTGVALSVKDKEFLEGLKDEVMSSSILGIGTPVTVIPGLPYMHVHFFADGIEVLIKLDEK